MKNAGYNQQLLLEKQQRDREWELIETVNRSSGLRYFNLASVTLFFISSAFSILFFGFLDTPLLIFYVYFIFLGIWNVIFQCLKPLRKAKFLRARLFLVYAPCLLLVAMQIASLVFFLRKLDEINDKVNNMYPVDEETLLMK